MLYNIAAREWGFVQVFTYLSGMRGLEVVLCPEGAISGAVSKCDLIVLVGGAPI